MAVRPARCARLSFGFLSGRFLEHHAVGGAASGTGDRRGQCDRDRTLFDLDGICVLPGRAGGAAAPWRLLVCLGAVSGRGAAVHGYGTWRRSCARADAVFGGTAGLIIPGKIFAKIIEKSLDEGRYMRYNKYRR